MPALLSRRPAPLSSRRLGAVVIAAVALASACGGGDRPVADAASIAAPTTAPAAPPADPNEQARLPVSVGVERSVAPTPTVRPAEPHETFVANIREEIEILEAFVKPDGDPARFEYAITNPTFFGNPLALMVTDRTDDGRWLKVQIPVRPNGTEAWVRADDAVVTSHFFRARVDLSERAVTVWNGDDIVVETAAVIGREATPTPIGTFFVNDLVEKWESSAYGPQILSLSGFSETLDTFAGGIPVIAIHGTNRPDLMGGAHSNGCIRVPNDVVQVLADTVPIGTPVDIVA